MSYPDAAWERAMTVQEVVLKAIGGELHWFQAADILGMSAGTLRRWRERYEQAAGGRLHVAKGRTHTYGHSGANREQPLSRAAGFPRVARVALAQGAAR